MNNLQPLSAKLGEVRFRQKLVKQHLGKENSFTGEPGQKEIITILKERIDTTRRIFKRLEARGITLSPFLEIGAEKGQRSMVLVNDFGAGGFASDISYQSLKSGAEFAKILGYNKLPALVCCDAYHLPFTSGSIPFVFCFETLHHFPDPAPILKEVFRILTPGGVFYFGEEPVKQSFNLRLWRRGYRLNPLERFLKTLGILPFLSRIGATEVSHGILEEEFSFRTWKIALKPFSKVEGLVSPVFFGPKSKFFKNGSGWKNPSLATLFLVHLQGGGIECLAIKEGKPRTNNLTVRELGNFDQQNIVVRGKSYHVKTSNEMLICPDCKSKLLKKESKSICPNCKRQFNLKEKVLMLLPTNIQKKLYG